ncbi:MAG: 16S rRNA (adenine(1518)-N(6)/adenine(1519)-N(6))-dimethyltransferase RsmA [Christensenella sp.]|nr:16S rRNA (adenine(1518)-N(6)/adenine(1519)-N(6))-dimethyltransferase RsmA [Christensenella sp.]
MSDSLPRRTPLPDGFVPNKALGQNFLSSDRIIESILDEAQIDGMRVLEIGPGAGALTEGLLARASYLAAVEKDGRLCELLQERFGEKLKLLHADVLDADITALMGDEPWFAVGNLPYYATTPIVLHLLSLLPEGLTLMVQKEAAERFFAQPKGRVYGPVSVLTQCFYTAKVVVNAPRGCFNPPPEVDSLVVRLTRNDTPTAGGNMFLSFLKQAFSMRRKTMANVFQRDERLIDALAMLELPADIRAEALPPETLLSIFNHMNP